MKTIVLATSNNHKLKEMRSILSGYEVLSLKDIGFSAEIDETGETTQENSEIKAKAVFEYCKEKGLDYCVIADDAGLFIESLNGEPGVHSARYAADHGEEQNRQKVLSKLEGIENRKAYFECNICYIYKNEIKHFVGRTYGEITKEKIGSDAFGYDCLFFSDDLQKTFGQATDDEKNSVSHRGRAAIMFKNWLDENV